MHAISTTCRITGGERPRAARSLQAFAALALAAVLLAAAGGAGAQALPDFTGLVEQNAPAIVNISTVRRPSEVEAEERETLEELLRYFYGDRLPEMPPEPRRRERAATGSGFIISQDGYVVTNHHVVAEADRVTVTLNDRREFNAEVIGTDELSDLALLKISAEGLPAVKMAAPGDLKVGEWVLAIGSPFGLSYSVAAGIVSYIGRNLPIYEDIGSYVSYIQTDVAINPGHSGGPLFNLDGEVVGINSQIFTSTGGSIGLSFAIPVDVADNVLAQLRGGGVVRRGWMGVEMTNVSPELAEAFNLGNPHGALVNQVLQDSPAEEAGFLSGDVILNFDGNEIIDSGDLRYNVGLVAPGTEVEVQIVRDGQPASLRMTVGDRDELMPLLTGSAPAPAAGNQLGIEVSELDERIKEELGIGGGVLVERVVPGGVELDGIRAGDILISINGEEVDSVSEFETVVEALPGNRYLPILVARNGRQDFFTIRIPEE